MASNSHSSSDLGTSAEGSYSNFEANLSQQPDSLWNQDLDALRLPPINPNNTLDQRHFFNRQLPHFNEQNFDHLNDFLESDPFQSDDELPPPSNHEAQANTPPLYSSSTHYGGSDELSFDNFNWAVDLPQGMAPAVRNTGGRTRSGASSVVDLTASSPPLPTSQGLSRKRKAITSSKDRESKLARWEGTRSASVELDTSNVPVVDLSGVENQAQYEQMKAKELADRVKQQQLEEANKPVKLATFQCSVCMDNPTNLSITHCGMFKQAHQFLANH